MNLRSAISVPLPWLTIITGKFFGKKPAASAGPRRSRFKLPRSLTITSWGKWYIGLLFVIGIAAINTSNNLLYLVSSTLLALIVVSGVISEHTMRKLSVARSFPKHIYKGTPVIARFSVANRKKFFPAFSFNIKELDTDGVSAEAAYFLKINPREEASRTANYTFNKRGLVALSGVKTSTQFPFGLFLKGREDAAPAEVLVYPDVSKTGKSLHAEGRIVETGLRPAGKGAGAQIYGLREYSLQDDARFIYWRAAARSSRLLLKEFEKEREKTITIAFDNFRTPESDLFEELADEAASLANHYINRGFSVGLKTLSAEIKPDQGHAHLHAILRALALAVPVEADGRAAVRLA